MPKKKCVLLCRAGVGIVGCVACFSCGTKPPLNESTGRQPPIERVFEQKKDTLQDYVEDDGRVSEADDPGNVSKEKSSEVNLAPDGDQSSACEGAVAWLKHLAKVTEPWLGGRRMHEGKLEAGPIETGIASAGFVATDVNVTDRLTCPISLIREQLSQRQGECFRVLVHAGDTFKNAFGTANPALIRVEVDVTTEGCNISALPDWYTLTFKGFGSSARLVRVDYLLLQPECPEVGPC